MEVLFSHTIWFPNTYQGANTKSMPCISWLLIDPNISSLNRLKTFNSTFKVNVNKNNNMGSTMIICVSALHSPGLMSPLEGVVNIHHEPQLHVLLLNWANQSIHLFLVGCLNPCLQRTNVKSCFAPASSSLCGFPTCTHQSHQREGGRWKLAPHTFVVTLFKLISTK